MRKPILMGLMALGLQACTTHSEIKRVKDVLNTPMRGRIGGAWEEHAEDLKPLGARAFRPLATFLKDEELGRQASETMLTLDENHSAPILFRLMPDGTTSDVTYFTFVRYAPWNTNGASLPFQKELYDAAVRCLKAKPRWDVAEIILTEMGYMAKPADIPLIERYYGDPLVQTKALGALARLGQEKYLGIITAKLSAPLSADFPTDRWAQNALGDLVMMAGDTKDPRFTKVLCRHLNDPPLIDGDLISTGPEPGRAAPYALDQIVNRTNSVLDTPADRMTTEHWKGWCAKAGF